MSDRRKSRKCIDCRVAICRESKRCRKCAPKVGAIPRPGCIDCGKPCYGTRCRLHNAQHQGRLRRKLPPLCPECNEPYSGRRAKRCHKCEVARHSTRHKQHDEIWALYELGLPISDIARRLGVSKNTISGYAWRQGWVRREPEIEFVPQRNYFAEFTAHMCLWADGDPGTPTFHFCGAPALEGKSYCAEHAAIVYMPTAPQREAA